MNHHSTKQCRHCGLEFHYMDEHSPMLRTQIWEKICLHFGYDPKSKGLFLCRNCMEKALKRGLELHDLNTATLFNSDYIKSWLSEHHTFPYTFTLEEINMMGTDTLDHIVTLSKMHHGVSICEI